MKSIWKGSISFGLVNIPVTLYSAISSQTLGFKLLHDACHTPIKYQRWCSHCDVEVPWENIVKGMPLENGTFFIITKEKLEELKPAKSDRLEIKEFIPSTELSFIYIDNHYYLLPTKETDKAFFLFFETLKTVDLIAIGVFVLREKEHLCAINPYKKGLLLSTLNYSYEIKELKKLDELSSPEKITASELNLAKQLVKQLTKKKFDISKYKDTFAQKLKARIKEAAKLKEKKPSKVKEIKKQKRIKTPSLVEALKASLDQAPAEKRVR